MKIITEYYEYFFYRFFLFAKTNKANPFPKDSAILLFATSLIWLLSMIAYLVITILNIEINNQITRNIVIICWALLGIFHYYYLDTNFSFIEAKYINETTREKRKGWIYFISYILFVIFFSVLTINICSRASN